MQVISNRKCASCLALAPLNMLWNQKRYVCYTQKFWHMYNNNTSHCLNISSYFLSWSSFASTSDSSEPEIGLPSAVDFFTLSLHRSSGRHLLVVRCCAREMSMAFKNGGNSHQLRKSVTHWKLLRSNCGWGLLWFIFSQLQLNSGHVP